MISDLYAGDGQEDSANCDAVFGDRGTLGEHREEAKAAYHRLGDGDKLLILLFVLNSIMLVATAIYAPTVTYTWFYKGWQGVQFAFMVYIAYHLSHRRL